VPLPKNITIGEMWDTGRWDYRLWILSPFIGILVLLGSLFISALTDNALWFLYGYPITVGIAICFKAWDKRL
jgi:hypothetical protein